MRSEIDKKIDEKLDEVDRPRIDSVKGGLQEFYIANETNPEVRKILTMDVFVLLLDHDHVH